MKTIKNIFVAIDFSVTGRNAYRYAKQLAQNLGATLTVVNVKDYFILVSDVVVSPFSTEEDVEITKELEQLMAEEIATEKNTSSGNKVKTKILEGDPANALIELSKQKETDLIVIGSSGLQDVLSKISGSISTQVSNKAHCPVILVPSDAKWHSLDKILYASTYDSMTPAIVKKISDFAMALNTNVHFVHIKDFNMKNDEKEIEWNELFISADSKLQYETHTLYGDNIVEELKKYCDEKKLNLMTFVSEHRNFWQNLTHKSITENMASETLIPMLIVHLDDND